MNWTPRSAFAALAACSLLAQVSPEAIAQRARARSDAKPAPERAADPQSGAAESGTADDQPALPADLLPVPEGEVTLGTDPETLVEQLEAINRTEQAVGTDLRRMMSELGGQRVTVPAFYLGKYPVTNAEYKRFVDATNHRFPLHWWSEGTDDLESPERFKAIQEEFADFPADSRKKAYWERHWRELPWAIPTVKIDRVEVSTENFPVIWVSWKDASAYARWVGMRLPEEAEWLRAALGDSDQPFVWGDDESGHGLKSRGLETDRLFEVGHFSSVTTGPYGHSDLAFGVGEWTGNLGFYSLAEEDDFGKLKDKLLREFRPKERELWERLQKEFPDFRNDRVVVKGGTYASKGAELRPQTRIGLVESQTVSAVGFRVAKTAAPGRDAVVSALRLDYERSFWPQGARPNLDDQVGIERYRFEDQERKAIKGYDTVSFVPSTFAATTDSKLTSLSKLAKASIDQHQPIVLGTLVVSIPLAEPAVEAGVYTLCFRAGGAPKNFQRDVKDAAKAYAEDRELTDKDSWVGRLAQYGIRREEVEAGPVDYVRFANGDLKVPFEHNQFLLRNADGQYVYHWRAGGEFDVESGYEPGDSRIEVEAKSDGSEIVTVSFGVPQTDKTKKVYATRIELKLAPEQAGGDNWVLPRVE